MSERIDAAARDAYVKKCRNQLDELSAEIDALRARADQKEADAKLTLYAEIQGLENRREALKEQVDEVDKAADHAWEDLKQGAESAWSELEDALSSARSRFH